MLDALPSIDEELGVWAKLGVAPRLWWRDDDAYRESEPLRQLRTLLSEEPLLLAVVPGLLEDNLVRALKGCPTAFVLQHGWKHLNHAGAGALPSEYPPGRARGEVEGELSRGQRILRDAFAATFQCVFVPPWHRCERWILHEASALGFAGVSGQAPPFPLLRHGYPGEANIEIDIADWTLDGEFVGAGQFAARVVKALRLRRQWSAFHAPIGILSHHERMTPDDFRSLSEVIALFRGHRVEWAYPESLFASRTATEAGG